MILAIACCLIPIALYIFLFLGVIGMLLCCTPLFPLGLISIFLAYAAIVGVWVILKKLFKSLKF